MNLSCVSKNNLAAEQKFYERRCFLSKALKRNGVLTLIRYWDSGTAGNVSRSPLLSEFDSCQSGTCVAFAN